MASSEVSMSRRRGWQGLFLGVISLTLVALSAISATGAVAVKPPGYFVDETKLPFVSLAGTTTTRYWGVQGGAGYRIEVPTNWNGELVLYAHGYRGNGLELSVSNPSIRAYLLAHGYAWAASSYATNGYDVSQGVKDTHDLGTLFNGKVGHPARTYLMGHSMGGHITGVAIEQYPNAYVGALPMCGVMGDNALFDYFVGFQLLAQNITGITTSFPFPSNYATTTVPQLKAATINISGGNRPLMDYAFSSPANPYNGNFLFAQGTTFQGGTIENPDTIYQLDFDPAVSAAEQALNDSIQRLALDPQSRHPNGLGGIPAISGNLSIPVLSLHTIGDFFVPFSMEQIYANRVAANGDSDLLVSRAYRDVLHCGFTVAEQEQGFADLVNWVENGVKPAGDEILTPSVVAAADFGCNFTLVRRSYDATAATWPCLP